MENLKIQLVVTNFKHHKFWMEKFSMGLDKHNIPHQVVEIVKARECDLVVGWGYRVIDSVKHLSQNFLMAESTYLTPRLDNTYFPLTASFGFNGLNGRANFLNKDKDDSRWNKHFNDGRLQEWKKDGEYFLVTGQILADQALRHMTVSYDKIIENIPGEVIFCPHPRGNSRTVTKAPVSNEGFETLVKRAKAVVTINSNSGVDSVVSGVPVMCLDEGSMCWDICMKEYSELSNLQYPNRQKWLNELSWCQWFPEETSCGDTWDHLKQFYI